MKPKYLQLTSTPLLFLLILFIFILDISEAISHEIHLKNGRIIKTQSIQKVKNSILYELYGGTITIKQSEVKKIVYSNTKNNLNKKNHSKALLNRQNPKVKDLVALLNDKLKPKTPIERANLATLSIKTHAGSGSGFFINDQGLIITNRHVVRGSEQQAEDVSQQVQQSADNVKTIQKQFSKEKKKINSFEKKIRKRKQELAKYRKQAKTEAQKKQVREAAAELLENQQTLYDWKQDYQQRKKKFDKEKRKFKQQADNYNSKLSLLASQYQFSIILADGSEKWAKLYQISDSLDLALLKLHGYKTPYLKPAIKAKQSLGQPVYAIGSPLNLANSVTSGVLSSYRNEFIQTNADIYPGNSGGPLVNEAGEVLGVNTMKLITEKFEGLGFAITIDEVFKEFKNHF